MSSFVLVQLSDPHIGATWAPFDPLAGLRSAVEAVRRLPDRPDAVLVSGDLADHGSIDEYALVEAELGVLDVPTYVLPGNHDDRAALRERFRLPGRGAASIVAAVELGPLRLLLLDSAIPGADRGDLDGEQLDWLERSLAADPHRPTVLALHHPPLRTGIAAFDDAGLFESARLALDGVVARHPQVRAILAGHLHRPIVSQLGGRVALVAPSTYAQLTVDPQPDGELRPAPDQPPAFLVHRLTDDGIASYTQVVADRSGLPRTRPPTRAQTE